MNYKGCFFSLVISTVLFFTLPVFAYDQPVVNLGYTSFMDGGPPAGPGWYFQNYFQYYPSNLLADEHGSRLAVPRTTLNAVADIVQLIYLSTKKVLGANLGISAVLPVLLNIQTDDGLNKRVLNSQAGAADLFIGPALQFDPIMRPDGKGPLYVQRIELDVVAPVGSYNRYYAVNPSTNFWSLNPYWAATIWVTPKLTLAYRIHYLWNGINREPFVGLGPNVYNTQAGQAVFANIASEYGFTENFHIGVNGYFFSQSTDTCFNGIPVPGRREKVWAIGPGLLVSLTKNQFMFVNFYSEQNARNRPQGNNLIVRFVSHLS